MAIGIYAATTMTAIAEEADVAVQTLYAAFGSKRAILTRSSKPASLGTIRRDP